MWEIKSHSSQIFLISKGKCQISLISISLPLFPLNKLADNRWLWHGLPYPSSLGLGQEQTWRPYPEFLPFQFWENSHHKSDSASSAHVALLCSQHKRFSLLGRLFPLYPEPQSSGVWNPSNLHSDSMPWQKHGLRNFPGGTIRRKEPGQGKEEMPVLEISCVLLLILLVTRSQTVPALLVFLWCFPNHCRTQRQALPRELTGKAWKI